MEWYTDTVIKCIIAQCIYDRMILFMFLKFVCSHRLRYVLKQLQEEGIVERVGSTKKGQWIIKES